MASEMKSSALGSELFLSQMTCFLGSTTLARLEAVCRSVHGSCIEGGVWAAHFQQAMPCFDLGGHLRESLAQAKSSSQEERRKTKDALGKLMKLGLPRAAPMPLTNVVVANRLGCALSATSMADVHLGSGGGLAVASALCFRFPDAAKIASGPQVLGHWDAPKGGALRPEDWVVSEPGWVRVPTTTVMESRSGDIKIRSSFFDIQVKLAYHNATTMVSALACGPDNFLDSVVVFDFSCLEPDFLVHARDMSMSLDGEWREVKGLRATCPNPKRLSAAMASGLTCVLSFRDVVNPNQPSILKVTAALSALNLESLSLRPTR